MQPISDIAALRARLGAIRESAPVQAEDFTPVDLRSPAEKAGVPPAYRAAQLEHVESPQLLAWLREPKGPALLWGDTGRGKTWAACACVLALRAESRPARFASARDLLRALQREIATRATGVLDTWCEWPALVVLDDIGREWLGERTGWARERIADVIAHRIDYDWPLLVTTNLAPAEMAKIDAPIASRLSSGLVLRFEGPDRRIAR